MIKEIRCACTIDGELNKSLLLLAIACFIFSPFSTFIGVAIDPELLFGDKLLLAMIEILSIFMIRVPLFKMTKNNVSLIGDKKIMLVAIVYLILSV